MAALLGTVVVACGDDDNDKNACEQAADVQKAGLDDYCAGKAATCWFCDCYLQGKGLNTTVDGTTITYSCTDPDPVDPTCDGTALDHANTCLNDQAACQQEASNLAQQACDASTK